MPRASHILRHRPVEWFYALLAGAAVLLVFLASRSAPLVFDEVGNFCEIGNVFRRALRAGTDCRVVALPGYHIAVAFLLKLTATSSLPAARTASFLLNLLLLPPLFFIARILHPGGALLRVLQVLTFPLLLPLLPLLYTDPLGLALILWALWAALRGHSLLSALFLTAAVAVRQNAVLWLPLLVAILAEVDAAGRKRKRVLQPILTRALPFLLPVACVLALYVLTGSISLNRSAVTPAVSFSLGNVFFALFLLAALCFPLVCGHMKDIARFLRWRTAWLFLLFFALAFTFGFFVSHPVNLHGGQLRDGILLAVSKGGVLRLLFFVVCALGFLTVASELLLPAGRIRRFMWMICAFLSLASIWMIETRYALVPIVLFLLFRKPLSWRVEAIQVLFNFVVLGWVYL